MAAKAEDVERAEAALDDRDRKVDELYGFVFGERVRMIRDYDEDAGPFIGDEGVLVLETVGAPEYRNERDDMFLLVDGTSEPVEIAPDVIERKP